MKQEYTKPKLEMLGEVRDLTAATGSPFQTDVPNGTPANPSLPGFGVLGSGGHR